MAPSCGLRTQAECEAVCGDEQLAAFIRQDEVFRSPGFWRVLYNLDINPYQCDSRSLLIL